MKIYEFTQTLQIGDFLKQLYSNKKVCYLLLMIDIIGRTTDHISGSLNYTIKLD